jgi:hypothetical protein
MMRRLRLLLLLPLVMLWACDNTPEPPLAR